MAAVKQVSDAQIESALRKHNGLQTFAARHVGMSWEGLNYRVKNSPRLLAAMNIARETVVDHAENNVLNAIVKDGDLATSKWALERLGKKRGYGNQLEHGVSEDDMLGLVAALGGDPEKLKAFRQALEQPPAIDVVAKAEE